jgi:alpha-amylase
MGVMMQAFYWDCPREEGREYEWWNYLKENIPHLAELGFTALWLPPVHKAGNLSGPSMGYDPYDYYDLGEFDQKGSIKTWFGSKSELLELIKTAHEHGFGLIADMVINHNNGADEEELNPIINQNRWTLFNPASQQFKRNWECFHPNYHEEWDEGQFGDMPDLSHGNPYVWEEILKLAKWMIEEIGFDGFRYDFVKGYGARTITAIQEHPYTRDGQAFQPYGVAEYWDNAGAIINWANASNFSTQNPVDAFDFPLRELLKSLCDSYGFSLHDLVTWDTVLGKQTQTTVTFVENHDLRDEGRGIVNDKLLAYSYIFAHEGYPCVFWKDYYNYQLAQEGTANGIAALMNAHENYAAGTTETLWLDDNLYIMQRTGVDDKPGLIYVLNNRGDSWNGNWVQTRWQNVDFHPVAWWSASDLSSPSSQHAAEDGRAQFWAAPRGYAIYAPELPT